MNIMKKLRSIPGYLWAAACLILIPVTFIKNDALAGHMARLPFMKIHPKYSGGTERAAYVKDGLHISVFEPVYNGITGKGSEGFVQVKFSGKDKMPALINESIDYDLNGDPDFIISIHTADGATKLEKLNNQVQSLLISSKVKDYWLIRVNVDRD
jgi:hypothetical protein